MSDADKIKKGESLSLYNDLIKDSPSNVMKRINDLSKGDADKFASEIGAERLEALGKKVTSSNIADSLSEISDDKMSTEEWGDLRATDF
jgi:hypothetical protein